MYINLLCHNLDELLEIIYVYKFVLLKYYELEIASTVAGKQEVTRYMQMTS